MRTHTQTPAADDGIGVQQRGELDRNPIVLTLNRQSQSSLNRDLSIVRDRLAVVQDDPGRSKLARLLGHLQRQIEMELCAKGTL